MRSIALITLVGAGLLSGCAGQQTAQELPSDHPASPSARTSPLPPNSPTLQQQPMAEGPDSVPAGHDAKAPAAGAAHDHHGSGQADAQRTQPAAAAYVCPMHPEVTSDDPNARCPKCGMKLQAANK